jgi:UDP-N-acetylglucosamine--N-acetylmuramyl-(pentapeptide) pyrophosphoryl-undecaprenol N-acetylglucosamine transferase
MNKKKIVLTGGGTAGHILPNLALAPYLEKEGYEVLYFGSHSPMDQNLVESMSGLAFVRIASGKLRRYFDFQNIIDLFYILQGCVQSWLKLRRIKPVLVFAKGGFVSVPVVWASWCLKIPVLLHESDISPGLANRLMIPFAKCICLSFPQTLSQLPTSKTRLTGLPVRSFLLQGEAIKGRQICNFNTSKPILMVMGGSQGSQVLDTFIWNNLALLLESYQLIHLARKQLKNEPVPLLEGYRFFEFVNEELAHLYACADIIMSRSGANTLFEILHLKKPALLIPLPKSVSRGEQISNAKAFKELSCGEMLEQENMDIETVLTLCKKLYVNKSDYMANMSKWTSVDAAEKIMETIREFAK